MKRWQRGMRAGLQSAEIYNPGVPSGWLTAKAKPGGATKASLARVPRRRRTHARMHVLRRDLGDLRTAPDCSQSPGPHREEGSFVADDARCAEV